jgi:hypothetical protein
MLRKEAQCIHHRIFLCQPNGDAELSTDDAHVDVGKFVWVVDSFYCPRSGEFRCRRADDLCKRMERLYFRRSFRNGGNVVSGSSCFLQALLEEDFSV